MVVRGRASPRQKAAKRTHRSGHVPLARYLAQVGREEAKKMKRKGEEGWGRRRKVEEEEERKKKKEGARV